MSKMILSFFCVKMIMTVVSAQDEPPIVEVCDMVPTTQCSKSCDGGWQMMKYVCPEDAPKDCECPDTLIYYQCNNRPCLKANATLLQVFYDQEDKNAEENEYVYEDEDSNDATTETP